MNEADKCVYYHYGGGEGVILCLYVNDILILCFDFADCKIAPTPYDASVKFKKFVGQ